MNQLGTLLTTLTQSGSKLRPRFIHSNLLLDDFINGFDKSLPRIIQKVVSGKKCFDRQGFEDKIRTVTEINRKNNKSNLGGITLLHAYTLVEKPENRTTDSFQQALVLAWAVEMVHSHSTLIESTDLRLDAKDDIPDGKVSNSVYDADLLRSFMHATLGEYFENHHSYKDFLQMYNKAFIYKIISRDLEHRAFRTIDKFLNFTVDGYDLLCNCKSAYPSFTLPVSAAMTLVDKVDEKVSTRLHGLCSLMGKLYQIQKDFKNCFGGEALIGTTGTDIQQGRCTWLAVAALQRFTPRQRIVFEACYGSAEPAHVERVKLLYDQVQLPLVYMEEQTALVEDIEMKAKEMEKDGIPSELFKTLLREMKSSLA